MIGDNYNKVLANHIFNRLEEIQTDEHRILNQPKLWASGFLFTVNDIENIIQEVNSASFDERALWHDKIKPTEGDVKLEVKKEETDVDKERKEDSSYLD